MLGAYGATQAVIRACISLLLVQFEGGVGRPDPLT